MTEMLGIDHPIASAPMSMHSAGALAASVSSAGGLGMFGGTHPAGAEWIKAQIETVRDQTDRPFGIGFVSHFMQFFRPSLDAAVREQVPVIAFSFGDAGEHVEAAKKGGALVMCQVQTADQAQQAISEGGDMIVAQGNEAGGHTGTINLLPLLTQVIEENPNVPVLAAGGIATGRSLAAALAAGADGAWVGTAFLATDESTEIADAYKQVIVEGNAEDTTYTTVFDIIETRFLGVPDWPPGLGARIYRNKTVEKWHGHEDELREQITDVLNEYSDARAKSDTEGIAVYMGQSASFVRSIRPAADVLRSMSEDAERILRDRARIIAP
jgi:nitronate monooxygenase